MSYASPQYWDVSVRTSATRALVIATPGTVSPQLVSYDAEILRLHHDGITRIVPTLDPAAYQSGISPLPGTHVLRHGGSDRWAFGVRYWSERDVWVPDYLLVSLTGLGGDLTVYNSTWLMEWTDPGYDWAGRTQALQGITLDRPFGRSWRLMAGPDHRDYSVAPDIGGVSACSKSWTGPSDHATPWGTYVANDCYATTCTDPDTCSLSSGATVTVQLPFSGLP